MKFTMQRNRTVASKLGHAVDFKKGIAVYVPPALWDEVQMLGAEPEDTLPDEPQSDSVVEPTDPAVRKEALFAVFEKMVLKNDRENFTAAGAPHNAVLSKELGWSVNAKERDAAWAEFRVGKDD